MAIKEQVKFIHKPEFIQNIIKEKGEKNADVIVIHALNKIPDGLEGQLQYSIISDLSEHEEIMLKKINKNYRYEIRRAEKENIILKSFAGKQFLKETSLFDKFEDTYNTMYQSKGIKAKLNRSLMTSYLETNNMFVTIAFYDEKPYVFHSYICGKHNARFLYSASPFREDNDMAAIIGRMNKTLHWHDMKLFKSMGISRYDWGGISSEDNPNGIDKFKMSFGGEVVSYYNIVIGNSFIGKIACAVKR